MKYIIIILFNFLILNANAKELNIFACEPEWASLAREIVGDNAKIFSATNSRQDPHHVRAKPSLISAMRQTDMVICSGSELEIGWLPILLEKAGNKNTAPNSIGYMEASKYVAILEKPNRVDRADGDVHPEGNPHVHLNPNNIKIIAQEFLRRVKILNPENSAMYENNYNKFIARWNASMLDWNKKISSLKGKNIIVYHKSFSYLLNWIGLNELGSIEIKPGISATASHLNGLLKIIKNNNINLVISTPFQPKKGSKWIAKKANIKYISLPFTVGSKDKSKDLFELYDNILDLLIQNIN